MSRRQCFGILLLAVLTAGASTSARAVAAHPFHVTIAEVNFNAETERLEVALRVYNPGDLEEVLGQRLGERVDLERTEEVDSAILDYLKEASLWSVPTVRRRRSSGWARK